MDVFPASRWSGAAGRKPTVEQAQGTSVAANVTNGSHWETVVFWLLLAGLFVASVLAGYMFWLKLSFR